MLVSVCYAFIYLFEVLACFMFYENFYNRKVKNSVCFLMFLASFGLQYGLSFLGIPYFNLFLFFICNLIISLLGYEAKIITKIFVALLLSALMVITEIIVVHLTSIILKMDFSPYQDNLVTITTQASLSKLLFFTIIFFIAKIFKSTSTRQQANRHTLILGVLPVSSLAILIVILRIGMVDGVNNLYHTALVVCSIFLLFANIFVFYVYEMVQKTNFENTQLQLEIQRSEISTEYYELLSKEYENSRILIHDIKNHFHHIAGLTMEGQQQEVIGYIDSISKDFGLKERIKYSENDLVDVIINRYAAYCKENGLKFEVEALCSKLEFMDRSDVSSLLDNLLTNAVEAAEKSDEKRITVSIYRQENSFVMTDHIFVKVVNSCDSRPKLKNGLLITSKIDSLNHGFGTKSIRRVVSKYNGDYNWKYDRKEREFEATVILQMG